MSVRNTTEKWGWPARVLHWVMALMILGMLFIGFYMVNIETDLIKQFQLIQQHKSFGFTVFVLAIIRVLWRLSNRQTPALPASMPGWQKSASHISHYMLYALIFWMPLSGWFMASSSPLNNEDAYPFQIPNMVFGLFELPDPFPTGSEALMQPFAWAHMLGAILLAAILVVHLAAALKHHFVDRDDILRRMIR